VTRPGPASRRRCRAASKRTGAWQGPGGPAHGRGQADMQSGTCGVACLSKPARCCRETAVALVRCRETAVALVRCRETAVALVRCRETAVALVPPEGPATLAASRGPHAGAGPSRRAPVVHVRGPPAGPAVLPRQPPHAWPGAVRPAGLAPSRLPDPRDPCLPTGRPSQPVRPRATELGRSESGGPCHPGRSRRLSAQRRAGRPPGSAPAGRTPGPGPGLLGTRLPPWRALRQRRHGPARRRPAGGPGTGSAAARTGSGRDGDWQARAVAAADAAVTGTGRAGPGASRTRWSACEQVTRR
jgi:hypothetical protein